MRRGVTKLEAVCSVAGAFVLVAGVTVLLGTLAPSANALPSAASKYFGRTPKPPVRTAAQQDYHERSFSTVATTPEELATAFDDDLAAAVEHYKHRQIEIHGKLSHVDEDTLEFATDGRIIHITLTPTFAARAKNYKAGSGAAVICLLDDVKEDCLFMRAGFLME